MKGKEPSGSSAGSGAVTRVRCERGAPGSLNPSVTAGNAAESPRRAQENESKGVSQQL